MFLDRKEGKKLHKGSVLVGYDLGEQYSQISYCIYGQEDVDTVATVVGTKQYNIPTMLCKRKGVNQWFYGKEAVKNAGEEDMVPVEDLLALAGKGEDIELDGESYDPVALLTLFVRRSMALMNFIAPVEKVDAIMFTVEEPDDRMVEILSQVSANMGLRTSHIYFQSHTESFYAFVLHQPAELWYHQVIACEHDGLRLKIYRMECNKRTTPVVVLIEEQMYETLVIPGEDEEETLRQDAYQLADERFLGILQSMCEGRMVSSVYLLGDDSLKLDALQGFLRENYSRIQVVGSYALADCLGDYDTVINEINIVEPDVLISVVSTPEQEYFLKANKEKLNVKIWYGLGENYVSKKGVSEVAGFAKKLIQKGVMHSMLARYNHDKDG